MQHKYQEVARLITKESSLVQFEKYIYHSSNNPQQLFHIIRSCGVNQLRCRINVWRLTLGVIPIQSQPNLQIQQLQQHRHAYADKKRQAMNIIQQITRANTKDTNLAKNPLMKAILKPQKLPPTINEDEFLKQEIKKDVDRTYQELPFFQSQLILKLISNILFVWCKHNPIVSYKQGMHQILASIVYVYFQSAYFSNSKPEDFDSVPQEVRDFYAQINNVAHAQADIYAVFDKVMTVQKQMYKEEVDVDLKGLVNPNSKNNSPILLRIKQITDHKLKSLDLDLFRMIKLQDVQSKSFLLRWIRCMHTRQFSLYNSFIIWDSIFLDYHQSPTCKTNLKFQYIDAMCLAMFIYMRSIVLSRQTANQILQTYQKFPGLEGQYLEELISLGWSICYALRTHQSNPNSSIIWAEDPKKKNTKAQSIQKAHVEQAIKQNQEKKKKQDQLQRIAKEKAKKEYDQDYLFRNNNKKTPSKNDNEENVIIFSPKSPQLQKEVKPKQSIPPKYQKQQVQDLTGLKITFEYDQWKQIEMLLKKSIKLNEDLESKSLCNKVIRALQQKVKEQAAKRK